MAMALLAQWWSAAGSNRNGKKKTTDLYVYQQEDHFEWPPFRVGLPRLWPVCGSAHILVPCRPQPAGQSSSIIETSTSSRYRCIRSCCQPQHAGLASGKHTSKGIEAGFFVYRL
jgi:hypothetical protein